MIYRATRLSRSEGFQWEAGTPKAYQRCSDVLMGCSVSERPYYVICGHTPLRVTISEGQRVDSRENRLYTAEEVTGAGSPAEGTPLLWALLCNSGSVCFPDRTAFEKALGYTAKHLPQSLTGHMILSENVPEYGTTVLTVFGQGKPLSPAPAWVFSLPDFTQSAAGMVRPAESFEAVYETMLAANSRNHETQMLEFLAYACGAEVQRGMLPNFAFWMRSISPDEKLVAKYFTELPEDRFVTADMLPILYRLKGENGDRILAQYARHYLSPEQIAALEEQRPPARAAGVVTAFAEQYQAGWTEFSLAEATPQELYELWCYIRAQKIMPADLATTLGRDANSVSILTTLQAMGKTVREQAEGGGKHAKGIMPALLYWYDEINLSECNALYGKKSEDMLEQVRMQLLPKRLQKQEFRDAYYEPAPKKPALREVQNLPKLLFSGACAALLLVLAGGIAGALLTRGKQVPPPAESSLAESTTTANTTTAPPATETSVAATTAAKPAVLRTQACRPDEEQSTAISDYLELTGTAPGEYDLENAVVCYAVTAEGLGEFSPDALPLPEYLIPYKTEEGSGIFFVVTQADGTLMTSQSVPAPGDDILPDVMFDLTRIERDLDARTVEPSAVYLLRCPDGAYGQLVCTVSAGKVCLTPYQLRPEVSGDKIPLTEGAAYSLADYLKWAGNNNNA